MFKKNKLTINNKIFEEYKLVYGIRWNHIKVRYTYTYRDISMQFQQKNIVDFDWLKFNQSKATWIEHR
jgi:hypothetical protein